MGSMLSHLTANPLTAHSMGTAILGGPGVGNFWQGAMKAPTVKPLIVPPTPNVANSQDPLDEAARQQQIAMQRGLTSTMLTGNAGLSNMGSTSKTLLGG
jgi:hypothetical protein